jgi:hypothetical protein
MAETFPIYVWINEERFAKLQQAGLADKAVEAFAGLKRLEVHANEAQKDELLKRFPGSKCDLSTTRSIELLPRAFKDKLFQKVIEMRRLDPDVVEAALRSA